MITEVIITLVFELKAMRFDYDFLLFYTVLFELLFLNCNWSRPLDEGRIY